MVFKAWLINKLNTGEAGGKLIYQGETLMWFCEVRPLMTAQISLSLSFSPFRCVKRELCRKQDVCLHFSPYSLSPETVWISNTPAF